MADCHDLLEGIEVGDEVVLFSKFYVAGGMIYGARKAKIERLTPKMVEVSVDGTNTPIPGLFNKKNGDGCYGRLDTLNKKSLKSVSEFDSFIACKKLSQKVDLFIRENPVNGWSLENLKKFAEVFMGDG